MIIGYTTGVYDMFHIGHLNILRKAKDHCDFLVVGVTTDELCEKRKKKRPVIPFSERVDIVKSIKYVDKVVTQADMDKFAAWDDIGFDIMFVGDDWKGTPKWIQLEKKFEEYGVKIHYFSYTENTSSTILREKLLKI